MDVDAHSDEQALIKYKMQLMNERDSLDPCYELAGKLLLKEIERIESGGGTETDDSAPSQVEKQVSEMVTIHDGQAHKMHINIKIPNTPGYNFIGKLLGPRGTTLKQLQMDTMTKMAIMGRGSMRDKVKEDECRKEGGKYSHLNQDLHIRIEVFAPPLAAYARLSGAMAEVQKFLIPELSEESMMYGAPQNGSMMGGPMGRGGPRGGFRGLLTSPRGGARGGGMSRGGAGARGGTPRGGGGGTPRGGMSTRGPSNRGGMAGRGPGMNRGSAASRGGAPRGMASRGMSSRGAAANRTQNIPEQTYQDYSGGYDSYQNQSYEESYEDTSRNDYDEAATGGYGDAGYGQQTTRGDNSYDTHQSSTDGYYDYGHGDMGGERYTESYGDRSWDTGAAKSMPASRGSVKSYRGAHQARPY